VTLNEYRDEYGVTFAHIARKCGVTPQSISEIARGVWNPSWKLAGQIEEATNGMVPRSQWFPPEVGKTPPGSTKKRR
jgi:DNA-binding XRE family transcriptional regulator